MQRLATFRTRPLGKLHLHPSFPTRHAPNFSTRTLFPAKGLPRTHSAARVFSPNPILLHSSLLSSLRAYLLGTAIFLTTFFGYIYVTDTRSGIHLLTPSILQWIYDDAEDAHEAGNAWLRSLYAVGLHPRERGGTDGKVDSHGPEEADLSIQVFGHTLDNPIGTSAGIDKHAEIPDALLALGPAIIELGGATPDPQDGNPRPRVFRLPSQKALVNRYGLNSEGADDMAMRLRRRVRAFAYKMGFGIDDEAEQAVLDEGAGVPGGSLTRGKLMAVQVAKNKVTDERDIEAVRRDYVYCVERLARYADIIVVNVSSPNTPGLRTLQRSEPLTHILTGVVSAARSANRATPPAVMVKVSPDEDSEEQVRGIADAVWASGVDGLIVGNSTKRRHDLLPADYDLPAREAAVLLEQGGYSGPQLFERTLKLVTRYRRILDEETYMQGASYQASSSEALPAAPPPPPANREKEKGLVDQVREREQQTNASSQIDETSVRDTKTFKPNSTDTAAQSNSQPLIQLPERHHSPSLSPSSPANAKPFTLRSQNSGLTSHLPSPARLPARKIIFASGGITTGAQALEVLEAGASVAQVYTALVYSGVGTITRMKAEMREEMARRRRQIGMEGGVDERHWRQVGKYERLQR